MSVFKFNAHPKPIPFFFSLSFVTGMELVRITSFQKQRGLISEPHGKVCFPKQDLPTHPPQLLRQCVPGCTELCPVLPLQCCLSLACRACGQHLFLPTHLCSTSSLHVILGVMGGRRRTSPPTLFTVSPCIHACFKSAINKCSGPDSVAAGEFQWFEVLVHLSGSVGCL